LDGFHPFYLIRCSIVSSFFVSHLHFYLSSFSSPFPFCFLASFSIFNFLNVFLIFYILPSFSILSILPSFFLLFFLYPFLKFDNFFSFIPSLFPPSFSSILLS
jgi:hypothetical protein